MASSFLPDILQLSVSERIQLVQDIWDSIAAETESTTLTDEQRKELDRRLDDQLAKPDVGVPWEDLKARLRDDR
jgi:putative addiction module component (TIGR02574 family)